ncbi:hypothetical protein EZS27_034684 [termite gut metagenome]|uniref:Uncharacterized protein n=1 Tax=termite gut metagenome TaxID=433724 RepID=A0A5J4Q1I1_9ZZZZ
MENNGFVYRLLGGKIEFTQFHLQAKELIKEEGLKDLINQATTLYNSSNVSDKQIAVEKLWDAFERLKTYHSDLGKKESAEKIVRAMSNENDTCKDLLN